MRCLYADIDTFPNNMESNRVLILSHNSISLKDNMLKSYLYLLILDLSYNGISTIAPYSFRFGTFVKSLDLRWNSLAEIRGKVFQDMISLQILLLQGNYLRAIDPNAFLGLRQVSELVLNNQSLISLIP